MTDSPNDDRQIREGTDITADPEDLEVDELPATSDPEAFDDDHLLGGMGGRSPGGAG